MSSSPTRAAPGSVGATRTLWGFDVWQWRGRLEGKSWGPGYYEELLPGILGEFDPNRPYIPSSPWSPVDGVGPNDPEHGSMHIWDLWNKRDYNDYRSYAPRFVAEFGWQGPPTWSTLRESISNDPLTPESPGMLVHQKALDGNDKLTDGLIRHLSLPDDIDDWHWTMSLNQAAAVRLAIEYFRSLSPHCSGSIVWQLNDSWPGTSWAAVDGNGRAKPLLYAMAHAYADRLVTVQPTADGLAVTLANDYGEEWSGELVLRRLTFDGAELAVSRTAILVAPRATSTIAIPREVAASVDVGRELIVASVGTHRGLWFFAEYRDSLLGEPLIPTGQGELRPVVHGKSAVGVGRESGSHRHEFVFDRGARR